MPQSALFDQIAMKLRVKADVSQVLVSLEEFTATFFSAKTLQEQQQIFNKLPKEIAYILTATLAKEPITPENQITIKRTIDELANALRNCKNIQLTIAFQPDDATITLFSDWIKKNVKPDILIDLQFDKSIVGGALLIAGGIYKDYSVRKNLATRFQIQRDEILELLT
ncbi:MAG TPA: F0F1 ATP synthase subunit delta [Candidatus Sulfotelmatobacter sp.]|jgi:F0F1-type ATP synthase delta subunit|nr:F0F1 ATP synthase subunit delta [Candidatus Sulfotelmatobacter sp.]